jgi:mRNA-degrading endonuclease RelE of RelBE toxin-antitoxin system
MVKKIEFTRSGERDFNKLSSQLKKRVEDKIHLYLSTDNPLHFAEPLINFPPATHRFRVGKYRICFYLEGDAIVIDGVDTREDAYRRR